MDQLLREFLRDAEELIKRLADDIATLRSSRDEGRLRRDLLARIFRGVHTLKGSASAFELTAVTDTAHELESLLDSLRLGHTSLDDDVLDAFDDTVKAITQMLRDVSVGEQASAQSMLSDRLRGFVDASRTAPSDASATARVSAALPFEIERTLSKDEKHQLQEALDEGARAYCVEVNFDLATFDKSFKDLSEALSSFGEIISTQPGMPGASNQINFRLVYATNIKADEFEQRLINVGPIKLTELSATELHETGASNGDDVGKGQAEPVVPSIETQAIPLDRALARAIRAGVVAARATGKEIDFEIDSGDIRVGKTLLDAISECVLHILRNAVDHGIETSAERRVLGKNARGQINLYASRKGSRMSLRITDDGRGIDPLRVGRAAIERGIIDKNLKISEEVCMRIIFTPGFSTAETVSNVSGRGIGLDVVEQAVKQIGGEIRVQSKVGVGTTFELLWPIELT